jgi:hypothetical protein
MEKNMTQAFVEQNYLIIEQNVVTNVCLWNGDTTQWTPPQGSTALVQATTSAMVWALNADKTDWVLEEELGAGSIGFTWDGTTLTTNQPKPDPIQAQPTSEGTQTA